MQNAVQRNQGANPQELASAMRKMEECLQVFAQLSGAPSPSPQKMLQGVQQPVQQAATQQATPQQTQQRVLSPTNNRLVFSIFQLSNSERKYPARINSGHQMQTLDFMYICREGTHGLDINSNVVI